MGRAEAAGEPRQARADFADFELGFSFDRYLTFAARPSRTGRQRFRLIGSLYGEQVVAALISPLGSEAIGLVSLRPASSMEKKAYGDEWT